jgi:hypothetical protein
MERCCCGNELRSTPVQITVSPCCCEEPGKGRSFLRVVPAIPQGITRQHYTERKKLGLPLMTDAERTQFVDRTWV